MPTPSFDRGTIVSVPFAYTRGSTSARRPALVVSRSGMANGMLLWVVMITSAENRSWPGDVDLPLAGTGLDAPSVVRTLKIATIETESATALGAADTKTLSRVDHLLRDHLGLA